MISRRRPWLVTTVTVLAACGAEAKAGQQTETPDEVAVPVRIASVTTELLSRPVTAVGTLGPSEQITLSFKVGGVVERVAVDVGDEVQVGEILAALHPEETESAVRRARSAAEQAERELARARRLHADSVVTLASLESAATAAEIARAAEAAAEFNFRHSVIRAPAEGVVLRRAVEPGVVVAPGAPVLTFGSRARGAVLRVGLADRDVVRLRRGDPAVVRFDALPHRTFQGEISEIGAAAEAGTGTYVVEIELPGATGLAAGLIGHAEIRPTARKRMTIVPVEAVLEADGERATLLVLSSDGMRAERRRVEIGFIDGDRIALESGLENVESVLTEGAAYADDGARVKVLP